MIKNLAEPTTKNQQHRVNIDCMNIFFPPERNKKIAFPIIRAEKRDLHKCFNSLLKSYKHVYMRFMS